MKDFDQWNRSKKMTDKNVRLFFHPREIWFVRLGENNSAILSQIRLIDAKRLEYKIGVLEQSIFCKLKKAISEILLSNDDF